MPFNGFTEIIHMSIISIVYRSKCEQNIFHTPISRYIFKEGVKNTNTQIPLGSVTLPRTEILKK